MDFLIYSKLSDIVAIEVKSKKNPSLKNYKGILAFEEERPLKRKIVICNTAVNRKTKEEVEIIPVGTILQKLWNGKLF